MAANEGDSLCYNKRQEAFLSITQTYDNYYRAYYLKNRKKILARTKEYRRKYARDYYYRKKAEKIAAEKAKTAELTQESIGDLNPLNPFV